MEIHWSMTVMVKIGVTIRNHWVLYANCMRLVVLVWEAWAGWVSALCFPKTLE